LDITAIHRSGFLPAQIRITLNDLECPIQLKVRFTDGTLGMRLNIASFGFDRTHRCSQRGRGSELEGLAPSMWAADALFLCGS